MGRHDARAADRQDAKLRPSDEASTSAPSRCRRRYLAGRRRARERALGDNQGSRWGSCTPVDRTIRLSDRLQGMPAWVVDYVLLHELAHLLVPGHGADSGPLVDRYPETERARGYLEGVSATAGLGLSDDDDDDERRGRQQRVR